MNAENSKGEVVIRVINEHWIKYVVPAFVFLAMFSASLVLFYVSVLSSYRVMWLSHGSLILALFLLLLVHHWFFIVVLSEAADCIIITNRRLIQIKIRLLQHDQLCEVDFDKMKSVEANKEGLLQNILNYGTLHFEKGVKGVIELVPHPHGVAREIEQALGRK